ncbi:hypothetical protein [Hydrogenophaga sp.]|uniref:hypothetical protein n=1 Tax=Hydrogenophaga sp. TaxID=1904254 RepID=UPI003F70CC91
MTASPTAAPRVVVAGAGGKAGSAVLREWLASTRDARVTVLTTRHFLRMPSGLSDAVVDATAWHTSMPPADHAVILFGAARREREAVFWQPARADLVPLAAALRARGARTLDLVLPDGAGLSRAERERLRRLTYERVTEIRPGLAPLLPARHRWPERLAAWLIATLVATMRQVILRAGPGP